MLCQKCGFSNSPTAKFCKQCGQGLARTTSVAQAPTPAAAQDIPAQDTGVTQCPQCSTPRVPGKRFCRSCRFDFAAQHGGEAAAVVSAPEEPVATLPEVAAASMSAVEPPRAVNTASAAISSAKPAERPEYHTGQSSEARFTPTSASVHTPAAVAAPRTAGMAAMPVSASASAQGRSGNKAWIIGGVAVVVIGVAVGVGLFLRSHHESAAAQNANASAPAAASTLPAAAASAQVAAAPAPTPAGMSPDAASTPAAAPAQTAAASETSAAPATATAATQQPQPASSSEAPATATAQANAASTAEAPAASPAVITGGPQVMTSDQDIKLRDCAGAKCATLLIIPKGTHLTIDPATIKVVTDKSGTQMPWAKISYEGLYCAVGTTCRHMIKAQMAMDGWLDVKSLVPVAP